MKTFDEHVAEIIAALAVANGLIEDATRAGLKVELRILTAEEIGMPEPELTGIEATFGRIPIPDEDTAV